MRSVLLICMMGSAAAINGSPVEKVLAMLGENKLKVQRDLAAEKKEMQEYAAYCDDETDEKNYAIKTAVRNIADLNSVIDDATAQVRGLDDTIATLGREMAAKDDQIAKAKSVRKNEHTDFEATEKELMESIDQIEKAIILLKRETSFAQGKVAHKPDIRKVAQALNSVVNAAWMDQGNQQMLKGLLQDAQNQGSASSNGAGENDDLTFTVHGKQSKGTDAILQSLQDMKQKAEETLSNARMTEMKGNHNYQMMLASLEESMSLSKTKLSESTALKAQLTETSGKAKGELADTKQSKIADEVYLKGLSHECEMAAADWADRQKSAADEVAAINKAIEILQAGVKAMLQAGMQVGQKKQPMFEDDNFAGQVDDEKSARVRARLIDHLKDMGHKFHSYTMMEMVSAATTDPFEKIRGLVGDMIAKLVAEANEEATQQAFCDEEKGKSNKQKEAKTARLDELNARLDKASAKTEELEDLIKELQAELADIAKASKEATKLRAEQRATFEKSSKDFKDAGKAVEQAIGVLKDFYASLLQTQKVPKKAGTSKAAAKASPIFGGLQAGSGSDAVIALLETSAEDFSRMLTQAETEEEAAKDAYEKLMGETKESKAKKEAEVKGAESEIKTLAVAMKDSQEDKSMTSHELDAVMEYLEKLKPQCEQKVMTYEEKKAKREAEIEGLKEALSILEAPELIQRGNLRKVVKHM
jgi:hypothetical protein